jgi:hypothetical protein
LRPEQLTTTEGEQLGGDGSGTVRGPMNLTQFGLMRGIGRVEEHGAEAQDDRHHVVDLVGDASREASHRVHALRLAQSLLRYPPLGHIDRRSRQVFDGTRRIAHRYAVVQEPADRSIGPDHPELDVHFAAVLADAGERCVDLRPILRVDMLPKQLVALDHLALAQAQQARHAAVHALRIRRQVQAPDAHAGSDQSDAQPLLAVSQPILRFLFLGQISKHFAEPQ